jgi:hypothetical protein
VFKKIVAAGLLVAALGAYASTVAWAGCPFWCTTGERMGDIRAGMTKDQVIAVLGRPDGFAQSGSTEALTYSNRLMSGFSWDRADYHVILSCVWSGNSSTKQRAGKRQDARYNSDPLNPERPSSGHDRADLAIG